MISTKEELEQIIETCDPDTILTLFIDRPESRGQIIRRLLESRLDAPVATCFKRLWQSIGETTDPAVPSLLRWYVGAEQNTIQPARSAVHRDVLTTILQQKRLPAVPGWFDVGFAAVSIGARTFRSLRDQGMVCTFLARHAHHWLEAGAGTVTAQMLFAAASTVSLGLLRVFVDKALDQPIPQDAEMARAIDWSITTLSQYRGLDPWVAAAVERRFAADPGAPCCAHLKVRIGLEAGMAIEELLPLLLSVRLDARDPYLKSALEFAYRYARDKDLQPEAANLAEMLTTFFPDWADALPAQGPALGDLPALPPPGADMASHLSCARRMTAIDLSLDRGLSSPRLQAAFSQLCAQIEGAPVPPDWTLTAFLSVADELMHEAGRHYFWFAHASEVPQATGKLQYGTADLRLIPEMYLGVMGVVAAICRAALDWLESGGTSGEIWRVARLAQVHTNACRHLEAPDMGSAFLERMHRHGIVTDVITLQRDTCHLIAGDMEAACHAPPPERAGAEAYPFQPRADWSRSEGVTWSLLAEDPPIAMTFDVAWPDGRVISYAHKTPGGRIETARVSGLSLLSEDLLIGPSGTMLRPSAYHTGLSFPRPGPSVSSGRGRAVRIRPFSTTDCAEPVLLLEAFEALNWHNYYHWVIPILGRICLAQESGLLNGRQLVVPTGLRSWMRETLDLVGVQEDRRMVVPVGHLRRFKDAVLMSSIEHLSRAALRALRSRVLGAEAAVAQDRPPMDGPFLFLSRRSRRSRKLTNEAELEALAQEMGFTLVTPEEMSVAEQARLFAAARGVAAPEGAALTNTVFCAPGTRILSIICQRDMMPIFNDLSGALGHAHRKLAGLPEDETPNASRFHPPFSIDLTVAQGSLAWVLGKE